LAIKVTVFTWPGLASGQQGSEFV